MAKGAKKQKEQKKRPYYGGGMPKGHKTAKVLEKEAARVLLRELVTEQLRPLVESQVSNALGIKYLVYRDKKTGKFVRVTEGMLERAQDENTIEVWEKDPSVHAFADLMDRALDKPSQSVDVNAKVTGSVDLVERLKGGRQRLPDGK